MIKAATTMPMAMRNTRQLLPAAPGTDGGRGGTGRVVGGGSQPGLEVGFRPGPAGCASTVGRGAT